MSVCCCCCRCRSRSRAFAKKNVVKKTVMEKKRILIVADAL